MPFTLVAYETRKPDLTPSEFQDYYDNTHMPIIKEAVGSAFPTSHARYYPKRQPNSNTPLMFIGSAENIHYDALVIMTFDNEQHVIDFQTKYADPEIFAKIGASADQFIVSSKLMVAGFEEPHFTYK
jgi:hypothetical protein